MQADGQAKRRTILFLVYSLQSQTHCFQKTKGVGTLARNSDIDVSTGLTDLLTVAAGQALASVLLHARTQDIWGSFLNQPIEDPDLRSQLTQLLGIEGVPQCLLRIGFGTEVKPTPRRELDDLWIT